MIETEDGESGKALVGSNLKATALALKKQKEELKRKSAKLINENSSKTKQIKRIKETCFNASKELGDVNSKIEVIKISLLEAKEKINKPQVGFFELEECNYKIKEAFIQLTDSFDGQIMDHMRENYTTNFFAQNRMDFTYICVQKIEINPYKMKQNEKVKLSGPKMYYRITKNTYFRHIWIAACNYWKCIEQQYILTDELFNNMVAYEDTVENFTKNMKAGKKVEAPRVYLIQCDPYVENLLPSQVQSIQIGKNKEEEEEDEEIASQYDEGEKKTLIEKIQQRAPGINKYDLPSPDIIKKTIKPSRLRHIDKSIWTWIFIFLGACFVVASIAKKRNVVTNFFYSAIQESSYYTALEYIHSKKITEETSFLEPRLTYTSFELVYYGLAGVLYEYIIKEQPFSDERHIIVGNQIHFVSTISKQVDCERNVENMVCYSVGSEEDSLNKTTLEDGSNDWDIFRTAEENNLNFQFHGEIGDYSGAGFHAIVEIPMEFKEFDDFLFDLEAAGFFSASARSFLVYWVAYFPEIDVWFLNILLYENTMSGNFIENSLTSYPFKPNIYETKSEKQTLILDVLYLLIAFLLFFICIAKLIVNFRKKYHGFRFIKIWKFQYLLIYINLFSGCWFAFEVSHLDGDTNALFLNKNPNFDFFQSYFSYRNAIIAQIISYLCLSLLFLLSFRDARKVSTLFYAIKKSFLFVMALIFVSFVLIFGLVLLPMNICGTMIPSFRSLKVSLLTLFRIFHFGETFPIAKSETYISFVEIYWMIVYYHIMIFFVTVIYWSLFAGIFNEGARTIRLFELQLEKNKDNEDFKKILSTNRLVYWLKGIISPFKCLKKLICRKANKNLEIIT